MKKKIKICTASVLLALTGVLAGCGGNSENPAESKPGEGILHPSEPNEDLRYNIYLKAQESGFNGSYEDWLNSIKGVPGENGKEIELSVQNDYLAWRYVGSSTWNNLLPIADLVGPQGEKGEPGEDGKPGQDGVSIVSIEKTSTEDLVDTYTITYSNGTTSIFTVTNGTDGTQGIQGLPGQDGHTPVITIGTNGNWYVDGVDTNIKAQGEKGEPGEEGKPGQDGKPGEDGVSIVGIEKTSTEGLVDTYTITYSNGKTSTFTVTNGTDGTQGIQGLPGQDGHTPVITIGTNGNWYVDGADTNIKAQGEKGEPGENGKPGQNGKSAYEIYCEVHPEYKKSEAEWLDDLVNGRLATEEKFMVSFNPNNGSTIASQEIRRGDKVKKPENPVKEGYTFEGWYIGDEKWVFSGYPVTEDIVLEAHYTKSIHTITIDPTNGDQVITKELYYGDKLVLDITPVKPGYVFLEWEDSNGVVVDESYIVKDNVTITAVWGQKFNITFDTDGGYPLEAMPVISGTIIDILPAPNKDGAIFSGWYLNGVLVEAPFKYSYTSDITLTAHWGYVSGDYECDDLSDGTVKIIRYKGKDTNVVIPNKLNNKNVTSIGKDAFYGCRSLTSITIPNTVRSIGQRAFSYCEKLTSITIPNGVISIGENAFYRCSSLTSITIPASVTSIGVDVFYQCTALESMDVDLDNPVYDSRDNCNAIIETKTNNLIIGCKNTKIPNTVRSIGQRAFSYCSDLTNIVIPGSVASIGEYAFECCTSLTSVVISNGVTSVGDFAFGVCDSLTSIIIPSSIMSLGKGAFFGCSSLENMDVDVNNPVYDSRDNCNAIIETKTNKLHSGCKNTKIPNSVTSIGEGAFARFSSLISITIPNSVTSIGDNAFVGCSGLTSIEIPNSVTSIGVSAFAECINITSIAIPNSLTRIEYGAFAECINITSIAIPNSVTSIGKSAFAHCSSLTSITIPNSVTSIEYHAFGCCSSLTSITIPNSVTSIGNDVFKSCSSLTSITIPNTVTSIGNSAFYDCSSLTSIEIPDSVTSIGNSAFAHCTSLIGIVLPNNITSIGDSAFYDCSSLTSVVIPRSVTSIGDSAFYLCNRLSNVFYTGTEAEWNNITVGINNDYLVNYPILIEYETQVNKLERIETEKYIYTLTNTNKVIFNKCKDESITSFDLEKEFRGHELISIGSYAFNSCSKLVSIIVPKSLKYIGERAFSADSYIEKIFYTGTKEEWDKVKFGMYNYGLSSLAICNYKPTV